MASVLVLDDDPGIAKLLNKIVMNAGHDSQVGHSLEQGLQLSLKYLPDVIILDLCMPDGNGLDWIAQFTSIPSAPEIIVITGLGTEKNAEKAIRLGAWDFMVKPFDLRRFRHQLNQALRYRKQKGVNYRASNLRREGIIGDCPEMLTCLEAVSRTANSAAPCLIHGETGVGKELIAQTIHANSDRKSQPLTVLDCASITVSLVESMLFGYVRGAFTGAAGPKTGIIEKANGGTLFLDEVGELPLQTQKAFLRVLQEQQFQPVGGTQTKTSRFRLLSATNRDLDALVREGRFRQDLFFRLQTLTVFVPPLRKRKEDMEALTSFFLLRLCDRYGLPKKGISNDFLFTLTAHDWPGNVRELINVIEHAVTAAWAEPIVYPKHLPHALRTSVLQKSLPHQAVSFLSPTPDTGYKDTPPPTLKLVRQSASEKAEKRYLVNLTGQYGEDMETLCRVADVSRSHLYSLLKKYRIGGHRIPSDGGSVGVGGIANWRDEINN